MKIEIYLDGNKVEINQDIDFVLNKQYTELTDLTSIIVDYTKTIKVPMTTRNNELFNMIYKLDHRVLGNVQYVNYDPTRKTSMQMVYNGNMVMEGYAILNKVDLKAKIYEINLYGQLGKIFSELKDKNIENYSTGNAMMTSFTMDRDSVIASFDNGTHSLDWDSDDWTDFVGFAPQILGDNDFLDTTQYEDASGVFTKLEDSLSDARKPLVNKGLDVNQYGEIRSYTTRPYVYVDKLVQMVKNEVNQGDYDGYKMLLDTDWFSSSNPYYSKMVYFPKQESLVTDERSINGGLSLNNDNPYVYSVPYNIRPSVISNDLEGYTYDLTDGLFTFTNEDGGMNGNIVIQGNSIYLYDYWTGTGIDSGGVNDVVFAMYNKNTSGIPVRYIGIYDEEDNLLYRLCLTQKESVYVHEESGFLNWSRTIVTNHNFWADVKKADIRNIVPNSATSYKSLSSGTFTRVQQFTFPDIVLDTSSFKMKFSVMDVGAVIYADDLDLSTKTYYEWPFKNNKYKKEYRGTHSMKFSYPNRINVSSTTHRSGSQISIVDILGSDFNPFTWLIDYAKKFRLFFDINYQNKTILLTNRYFHLNRTAVNVTDEGRMATIEPISYQNVIVDYDKTVDIEPVVNKYKDILYDYAENKSIKGIQYKKSYKVEYGDLDIKTGMDLNNETMSLIPDEDESVFIPTVTNNFTWSTLSSSGSTLMKPTQILQTNKVINTLDSDNKIQYFPFFCFRLDNVELTYDYSTPDTDKIRVSDDTANQKNLGQYCYLPVTNTQNQTVVTSLPQFDNYYIYAATTWASNPVTRGSGGRPRTLLAAPRATAMERVVVTEDGFSINDDAYTLAFSDDNNTVTVTTNGTTRSVPYTRDPDGRVRIDADELGIESDIFTTDGDDVLIDVPEQEELTDSITVEGLPGVGSVETRSNTRRGDTPTGTNAVNFLYWSTFTKPKVIYNGTVLPNIGNYSVYSRWENYLNEIFNQNNKKVTCYVRMSYPEFINFKFNKLFVIDGCMFLVNKIVDFNPNDPSPTKVELIQIQDPTNLK